MTPVHNAQGDAPDTPPVPGVRRARSLPPRAVPLSALLIVAAVVTFVLIRPHGAPAPVIDAGLLSVPPAVTSSTRSVTAPLGTTVTNTAAPAPRAAPAKPTLRATGGLKAEHVKAANDSAVTPVILDPFVAPKSVQRSAQSATGRGALPSLPTTSPRAASEVSAVPTRSAPAVSPHRPVPITSAATPLPLTTPVRVPLTVTLPSLRSGAAVAWPVIPVQATPRPVPLPVPAPLKLTPVSIPPRPMPASLNVKRSTTSAVVNAIPAQRPGLTTPTATAAPAPSAPLNPAEQWAEDNAVTYAGRAEGDSVVAVLTTRYGTVYADDTQAIPGTPVTITNTTPKSVEVTLGNAHTTLPLTP